MTSLVVSVGAKHSVALPGEGFRVWLFRVPGEGVRFRLESVGLDRLTVELDQIESVIPSVCWPDLTFVMEYPEQFLHPSEHAPITGWVVSMIRKGHRVRLHTYSPYILQGLNNALLAGQVRRNTNLPAGCPSDFWLDPEDVEAYRVLPDGGVESIFDSLSGLIDTSDLDQLAATLTAQFVTLRGLLR